jgi:hypothetical protein
MRNSYNIIRNLKEERTLETYVSGMIIQEEFFLAVLGHGLNHCA